MKKFNPIIEYVYPGSLAEEYGIRGGEKLRSVNGVMLRDIIDYQYLTAESDLTLEIENTDGVLRTIRIEKEDDDDLGIGFESAVFDGIRKCCNHCIFCFVDQMIKGQRDTLYVKDDDFRLSFLYGNYITLTNLSERDFQRIKEQRLSPLYISVHCLDETMRETILGRKDKRPFVEMLKDLSDSGIEMHGQIVLAPGYNDGKYLKETIEGIAAIDGFASLALVPVGLTKCKNTALRPYRKEEAAQIIDTADVYRERYLKEKGTRFVCCSDEFYLLADREIPAEEEYEDYPQIENGVGLIRQFTEDFLFGAEELEAFPETRSIGLITGHHGADALKAVLNRLNEIKNLTVKPVVVENRFFGDTVTVTGLLTGGDIIETLNKEKEEGTVYFLPDVLLKHHTDLLLDDVSVDEISEKSGCDIRVIETSGMALADAVAEIREERI